MPVSRSQTHGNELHRGKIVLDRQRQPIAALASASCWDVAARARREENRQTPRKATGDTRSEYKYKQFNLYLYPYHSQPLTLAPPKKIIWCVGVIRFRLYHLCHRRGTVALVCVARGEGRTPHRVPPSPLTPHRFGREPKSKVMLGFNRWGLGWPLTHE